LYSFTNIIKETEGKMWAGHLAGTEGERKVYKILVEKPEGKKPAGRPWPR
jgi:hypothetical protein